MIGMDGERESVKSMLAARLDEDIYIYIYIHTHKKSGGARDVRGGAHGVCGGACGVMVIVIENGHSDTSSNPGRDWLHFTLL